MGYKIVVKTLAEQDFTEALEWYNKRGSHFSVQLLNEIEKSIDLLSKNPEHYQKRYNQVRVYFIDNFPFGIYYTIENKSLFIHAFLHTRRNPKTGTERI